MSKQVTARRAIDLIKEICNSVKESGSCGGGNSLSTRRTSVSFMPIVHHRPIAAPVAVLMQHKKPIDFCVDTSSASRNGSI